MIKYAASAHDVTLELSYAPGGQAGHPSYGSQLGASLAYTPGGPVRAAVAYMDSVDSTNGSHLKAWTAGAAYTFGSTRVNFGYIVNRLDAGFRSFGTYTEPVLSALKYLDFSSRQMFFGGVTESFDFVRVSANVWRTLQTGKTGPQDGSATQGQLIVDYLLSRRTTVYAEADYGKYAGDLIGAQIQGVNGIQPPVANQLGAMVGIRHRF